MDGVFIHPTADVDMTAIIGVGTKVWNQAQIRERATIGDNCIIGKNVYIDYEVKIGKGCKIQNNVNVYHGVTIEDDVFLGPSMTFSNDMYPRAFVDNWELTETIVKKGASIGAGAVIRCGVSIGEYAMIGAGSVVINDIPQNALAVGNPARVIGRVCVCGHQLNDEGICSNCSLHYGKEK